MRIKVRILIPIIPGELKGQIRKMSPGVASIRAKAGSVEIVPEAEMMDPKPPLRSSIVGRPRGRKAVAR